MGECLDFPFLWPPAESLLALSLYGIAAQALGLSLGAAVPVRVSLAGVGLFGRGGAGQLRHALLRSVFEGGLVSKGDPPGCP